MVDVHLAEPVEKVGVCQTTEPVAGSVLAPIAWPRRRSARAMYAENLLRGVICHVSRTTGLSIFSSEMPCVQSPTDALQAANAPGPQPVPRWNGLPIRLSEDALRNART